MQTKKSLNTLRYRKYVWPLVSLPLVFIIWVSIVIFQAINIRKQVESKVVAISSLSQIRNYLTNEPEPNVEHDETSAQWLNDVELWVEPTLFQQLLAQLQSPSSDNSIILGQLNMQIDALRSELGGDSQKLGELWSQVTIIGLLACVFALASALLFVRILSKRQELQAANENLVRLNQELETINETKDRLFAIIGHDLRSPINSLKGLFDLVEDHSISQDEFIKFSSKLKHGVEHVHFALNNLLQWAHAQMQGIKTNPKRLLLKDLTQEVIDLLYDFAMNKQIGLTNRIDPLIFVWCDSDQIKLVLRNLISNALKFTEKGGSVLISAKQDNGVCEVLIQDNGIGMKPDKLRELFSSDSIKSGYGTEGEKGTGLGLILCKEFVEKNGGTLWGESVENQGTSFYFTLPMTSDSVS